jgi:hypothetical protein
MKMPLRASRCVHVCTSPIPAFWFICRIIPPTQGARDQPAGGLHQPDGLRGAGQVQREADEVESERGIGSTYETPGRREREAVVQIPL